MVRTLPRHKLGSPFPDGELSPELARLGIPVEDAVDEYERLQEVTATVAERFTQLFATN